MLPDKVKLLPFSKRIFLELGLKRVVDKQMVAPEEQAKSWVYSFVKMLCISKSYLYLSRRTSPDIYRLNLLFTQNPDSITVSLASKDWNFGGKIWAYLTYDSVHKLIKLLLPSYIGTTFSSCITDALVFEKYLGILKLTKGKIGIFICERLKKEFVQSLLKTFVTRIYAFECYMNQFKAVERLLSKFPCFDYLFVSSIEDSVQISRVLKCKAKELNFYFNDEYFTINYSHLVNLKNEAVKKLRLVFEQINYVEVENLIKQLHKCCSSLKHFEIKANFFHYHEFPSIQVYDHVVAYIKRMNDLKTCLGKSLERMSIDFYVPFYINGERDNTWIKAICENSEFKHWEFESHEEIVDAENLNGFEYRDRLEMNFKDAGCTLRMAVKVVTHHVEEEDQVPEGDYYSEDDYE